MSLLLQFFLQWIYLPVLVAAAACLGALVAVAPPGLNPPMAWFNPWRCVLSKRRFRVEWEWKPELWDRYAAEMIRKRISSVESEHVGHRENKQSDGSYELAVILPTRFFRGIGPARAMAIVASEGWSAEIKGRDREETSPGALRLSRKVQPSEEVANSAK